MTKGEKVQYWINEFAKPVGTVEVNIDEQKELHEILEMLWDVYSTLEEFLDKNK